MESRLPPHHPTVPALFSRALQGHLDDDAVGSIGTKASVI